MICGAGKRWWSCTPHIYRMQVGINSENDAENRPLLGWLRQPKKITTNVKLAFIACSRAHPKILDLAKPELSLPPFAPRQELPLHVSG